MHKVVHGSTTFSCTHKESWCAVIFDDTVCAEVVMLINVDQAHAYKKQNPVTSALWMVVGRASDIPSGESLSQSGGVSLLDDTKQTQ